VQIGWASHRALLSVPRAVISTDSDTALNVSSVHALRSNGAICRHQPSGCGT
jgi:hypothetical protein